MNGQPLFDINRLRAQRMRAKACLPEDERRSAGFLFDRAAAMMADDFADIKRDFRDILVIGARGAPDLVRRLPLKTRVEIFDGDAHDDGEYPVGEPESLDAVVALPYLHTVNDVPGFLKAVLGLLRPDGLFLSCFFGGNTLQELRTAVMEAEITAKGGASRRVHPMISHQDYAGLLQQAGFALPVVGYERLSVCYAGLDRLYEDLKQMGEGNALSDRSPGFRNMRALTEAAYRARFYDEGFCATFDIVHGIGWKPHESQQKPALRGSGTASLTEILEP